MIAQALIAKLEDATPPLLTTTPPHAAHSCARDVDPLAAGSRLALVVEIVHRNSGDARKCTCISAREKGQEARGKSWQTMRPRQG
jgi:hypothetical protein